MKARLFESLVANSLDAIVCADQDGNILTWNPAAERLFGYTQSEALGQSQAILLCEDNRAQWQEITSNLSEQTKSNRSLEKIKTRGVHKDGTAFPIEIKLSREYFDDHWLFLSVIHDGRALEGLEQKLALSKHQL